MLLFYTIPLMVAAVAGLQVLLLGRIYVAVLVPQSLYGLALGLDQAAVVVVAAADAQEAG